MSLGLLLVLDIRDLLRVLAAVDRQPAHHLVRVLVAQKDLLQLVERPLRGEDRSGSGFRVLHVALAEVTFAHVASARNNAAVRSVSSASAVEAVRVGRSLPVAEVGAVSASSNTPVDKRKIK